MWSHSQTVFAAQAPSALRSQMVFAFSGWPSQTIGPVHLLFVRSHGGQSDAAQGAPVEDAGLASGAGVVAQAAERIAKARSKRRIIM